MAYPLGGICGECGKKFAVLGQHLLHIHKMDLVTYREKYDHNFIAMVCDMCGKKHTTLVKLNEHKQKYHGIEHESTIRNKIRESKRNTKCEICSEMCVGLKSLTRHVKKVHNIKNIDYYRKYLMKPNEVENCKQCGRPTSFRMDRGFCDFCSFSCSTTWYAQNTDRVSKAMKTIVDRKKEDPTFGLAPSQLEYWLNKGFSEDEAKKKQSERQTTFSKKILIEKHGEIVGTKLWQERQNKWQTTMKAKTTEEIARINRAKMWDGIGYSEISQKLFNSIKEKLKNKNIKIYYATNYNEEFTIADKTHFEFMLINKDKNVFFLDFYIPEIDYCVEFDGDYWHGEKRGNQQRDIIREQRILDHYPELHIVHIKERDYNENPDKIVTNLVTDINNRLEALKVNGTET